MHGPSLRGPCWTRVRMPSRTASGRSGHRFNDGLQIGFERRVLLRTDLLRLAAQVPENVAYSSGISAPAD